MTKPLNLIEAWLLLTTWEKPCSNDGPWSDYICAVDSTWKKGGKPTVLYLAFSVYAAAPKKKRYEDFD